MENTIVTSTPSQGQRLAEGLRRFFTLEAMIAGTFLLIGFFIPPMHTSRPWFLDLPNTSLINLGGMLDGTLQFLVRFGAWLMYARMFRQMVVKNSFPLDGHLHEQVSEPDSTDSPAWLLFGGYICLGIILGIKVSYSTFWGFLFFAPMRVLFGSVLGLFLSQWLIRRETTVKSIETFCNQIGLAHVNGAAILGATGMILGGLFA